jgi:hypothetical protein
MYEIVPTHFPPGLVQSRSSVQYLTHDEVVALPRHT